MNKDEYLEILKNSISWFKYYESQKYIAQVLFDKAISKEVLLEMKDNFDDDRFTTLFVNAHYHWGIAIENALKAIIVKTIPESIEYEIKNDNVLLKSIGGKAGKTHNLGSLAELCGIFDTNNTIYDSSYDYDHLKQVLLHFTDMIKWGARYPLPNNTATVYKNKSTTFPSIIYGFHILDIINPLFQYFDMIWRTNTIIENPYINE
jgi:hypothetical protein